MPFYLSKLSKSRANVVLQAPLRSRTKRPLEMRLIHAMRRLRYGRIPFQTKPTPGGKHRTHVIRLPREKEQRAQSLGPPYISPPQLRTAL